MTNDFIFGIHSDTYTDFAICLSFFYFRRMVGKLKKRLSVIIIEIFEYLLMAINETAGRIFHLIHQVNDYQGNPLQNIVLS